MFSRINSSVNSFASSSNDMDDADGSQQSRSESTDKSQSTSSRGHQNAREAPLSSTHLPLPSELDDSIDVKQRKSSTFGRRRGSASQKQSSLHDSSLSQDQSAATKSSNSGTGAFRGLGRRLFKQSNPGLKPISFLAARSHSASSGSTDAQSPPLTPTTPPLIQPVSLANGHKDFFSTLSGLPSSINISAQPTVNLRGTIGDDLSISPKTKSSGFIHPQRLPSLDRYDAPVTGSRGKHDVDSYSRVNSTSHSPAKPNVAASSTLFASTAIPREIPAVIEEEEGDSDFLRAVLNFGEDQDAPVSNQAFRGGRAAPLPTRSSSLGQIAGMPLSPSGFRPQVYAQSPPHRTPDGRMVLTQEAARDFAKQKKTPSYVVVQRKYRKGLFGAESESDDEYGDDEDKGQTKSTAGPSEGTCVTAQPPDIEETASRFRSSFAKAGPPTLTKEATTTSSQPPGLDSAAKKALYNCTLLKVHMHLAATLAGDTQTRASIPILAAGEVLYNNDDLRFPRSINPPSKLRQHSSTLGFARSLHVALARTEVMRKLRRERLRIAEEVEISWFQRRYGSSTIPADQIARALQKRQMVSPEALAKPPIAAPQDSNVARVSGPSSETNGVVTWTRRPGFLQRTVVSLPVDEFAPGEVLLSEATKLGSPATASTSSAYALSFSPRVRVLAGLSSAQAELRARYAHITMRRQSRSCLKSENVWEGPDRALSPPPASSSGPASPSNKPKRLPPWLAPRSRQPTSPISVQSRLQRASSTGLAAFSTLHHNNSHASIPEVNEIHEQDELSSDEEVPLAQLQSFRAQRSVEKEKMQQLEHEIAVLRQRESHREQEESDRKAREEEARRIEAERVYQENAAATRARKLEENKRVLQEARERRGFTRGSVLLAEPNYGAGDPLFGHNRRVGSSPGSPSLTHLRAGQRDALQSHANLASESTRALHAQPEERRRSRTFDGRALSPAPSARVQAAMTPSPLVEVHRTASMASLASPTQRLPHRQSMAALSSPPITQLQASLFPPPSPTNVTAMHFGASPSMHHLSGAPYMLSTSPSAAYLHGPSQQYADPRMSMSMAHLQAQAYAAQQGPMSPPVMQRPMLPHTPTVSRSLSRTPLVSLHGDTVPSSAMAIHQQR